jgi:hypothetical protein
MTFQNWAFSCPMAARTVGPDALRGCRAYDSGARVRFRPVDGLRGPVIGNGDTAIITVSAKSHYPRKRFSIPPS